MSQCIRKHLLLNFETRFSGCSSMLLWEHLAGNKREIEKPIASRKVRLAEACRKACPSTAYHQAFRWNAAIKTAPQIVTHQTFLQEGTGVIWLARIHVEVFFGNSLLIVYGIDHQASSPSTTPFCIRQFFKTFWTVLGSSGSYWSETVIFPFIKEF